MIRSKKPFNLQDYLADKSQKVETANGHSVRIMTTDAKSACNNPDRILALVQGDYGHENALFYSTDGKCLSDSSGKGHKDLFLVTDEPEIDEFTQNIRRLITEKLTIRQKFGDGSEVSSTVFIDDETAKDIANGVLFYAAKEAKKNPMREITPDPELTEFEESVWNIMRKYYKPGEGYPEKVKEISEELLSLARKQIAEHEGLDVTDFCKPIDPGIAKCIQDHWWEMLDSNPSDSKAEKKRTPSPALTRIVESLTPERLEQTKKEMLTEPSDDSRQLDNLIEYYYGNIPDDSDKIKAAKHFYNLGKSEALNDLPKWKKTNVLGTGLCQINGLPLSVYHEGYRIELSDLEKLPKED